MFSPWLATIGAIFPIDLAVRRPPVARSHRPRPAARVATEPAATAAPSATPSTASAVVKAPLEVHVEAHARSHRPDPAHLCVVAYVPSDAAPTHLRAHPRIRNPFRAFPRRGADLVGLIDGRAGQA